MGGTAEVRAAALLGWAVLLILAGCEEQSRSLRNPDGGAAPKVRESARVHPARRCGECHGRHLEEWSRSAHATAADAVFQRARGHLPPEQALACDGCHQPLLPYSTRIAREGINCEVCHTALSQGDWPVAVALGPEQATKFGPFSDAKDHYFHKVAYSGFVTSAALCLSCHQDRVAGPVPIFTSGPEWKAAGAPECQSCHMSSFRALAAKGGPTRFVTRHDFGADRAKALAEALTLTVEVAAPGQARITLANAGAGHALPTDLPERRLWLRLEARGAGGAVLKKQERSYGRTLVDAQGAPAPFFFATAEREDTRLAYDQTSLTEFALPEGARLLIAEVWFERHPDHFDTYFGPSEPIQIHHQELNIQ